MGKWERVRLGDVCLINPPMDMKISNNFSCSVIPMDAVTTTGKILYKHSMGISDVRKGLTSFQEGDLLFAKITPCMENGKCTIAMGLENGIGFGSTEFHVFRPTIRVERKWLFHLIHSEIFRKEAQKNMTGSAGQKRVPASYLTKYKISLPPLPVQQKIAAVLDKASVLIEKRKAQIDRLDLLIKSRFVEMFGDPVTNPKGWISTSFSNITTKITDGEHGTVERYSEGRLYLMARNITFDNQVDLSEVSYISEADHDRIFKRCNPETGDLLLVCVGATIGKAALVPNMEQFSVARSVALLKPNRERVNSKFLLYLAIGSYIQQQIQNSVHSSAQGGLYTKTIKELQAYLPPIALQNGFASFVQQVEIQKSILQQSLDKLELYYKSMIQKCLLCELF